MTAHGSTAAYRKGCRCTDCRAASAAYQRRLYNDRILGRPRVVPAEPVRAHLRWLNAHGMSLLSIAATTGLRHGYLSAVLYGRGGRLRQTIRVGNAATILALRPSLDVLPDAAMVPALGSQRRIGSLRAFGWPIRKLAAEVGVPYNTLRNIDQRTYVPAATARLIRDAFDRLHMSPGGDGRSARWAAKAGHVPPMAWDEDDLDDPAARPHMRRTA